MIIYSAHKQTPVSAQHFFQLPLRKFRKCIAGRATPMKDAAMRAFFIELGATAIFVYISLGAVISSSSVTFGEVDAGRIIVVALAHGLSYAAALYIASSLGGGVFGGGFLNPAITLALFAAGQVSLCTSRT